MIGTIRERLREYFDEEIELGELSLAEMEGDLNEDIWDDFTAAGVLAIIEWLRDSELDAEDIVKCLEEVLVEE